MSEDTSARGEVVDQPEVEATPDETDEQPEPRSESRVSHSSYKKAVQEAKRERDAKRALEQKLKDLEDQRLADQGNKDELIKSLKAKLEGESKRTKDLYASFARKSLSAQLKSAAQEAGCIDPDAVMSLADLSGLDVDAQTFEADPGEVKSIITDLKKSKAYLFNKQGPGINGKLPSSGRTSQVIDFNGMEPEKIRAWLRANADK